MPICMDSWKEIEMYTKGEKKRLKSRTKNSRLPLLWRQNLFFMGTFWITSLPPCASPQEQKDGKWGVTLHYCADKFLPCPQFHGVLS